MKTKSPVSIALKLFSVIEMPYFFCASLTKAGIYVIWMKKSLDSNPAEILNQTSGEDRRIV